MLCADFSPMLFMVIERFKNRDAKPIYTRFTPWFPPPGPRAVPHTEPGSVRPTTP
jgi:hypothetical protein